MTKPCSTGKVTGVTASRLKKDSKLRKVWSQQGYLVSHSNEITAKLKRRDTKQNPSEYVKVLRSAVQSKAVVNAMTVSPEVINFIDGRPIDFAQMVPHLEIKKVYITDANKKNPIIKEILFPFSAFTDFNDFGSHSQAGGTSGIFRGRDAGIQNVDIRMEGRGRNPVSANVMDVTVKYYFNDVQTLFAPIGPTVEGAPVTYSDLIRYSPSLKKSKSAKEIERQTAFRIRLNLGWSAKIDNQISSPEFFRAVNNSKLSMLLDLYTHNLDFSQDGSVVITAKYKGALESAFAGTSADLLNQWSVDSTGNFQTLKKKILNLEDRLAATTAALAGKGARRKELLDLESGIKDIENMLENMNNALAKTKGRAAFVKQYKRKINRFIHNATGTDDQSVSTWAGANLTTLKSNALQAALKSDPSKAAAKKLLSGAKQTVKESLKNIDDPKKGKSQSNKKLSSKKKKSYRRQRRILKRKIAAALRQEKKIIANMKSSHMFTYVKYMQEHDMVAYVSIGKNSHFSKYATFVEKVLEHDEESISSKKAVEAAMRDMGIEPAKDAASDTGAGKAAPKTNKTTKDMINSLKWNQARKGYKSGSKLMFFTLGDLVTAILSQHDLGTELAKNSPDFRILFSEYNYTSPYDYVRDKDAENDSGGRVESLYNFPISLEIFSSFVAQKIVGTGRQTYPLLQFVFDLIKFIMDKLTGTFGNASASAWNLNPLHMKLDLISVDLPKHKLGVKYKTKTTAAKTSTKKPKNAKNKSKNIKGAIIDPVLNLNTLAGASDRLHMTPVNRVSNSFVLHSYPAPSLNKLTKMSSAHQGKYSEDKANGIFHFVVGGPDRGILKNIRFTEAGNSLFATSLMRNAQAGGEQSYRGLIRPARFSCDVTLVGNPYFFIGQMFYVNTDLISGGHFIHENLLNGGYYVVTSVEHSVNQGRWDTEIKGVLTIPDTAIRNFEGKVPKPIRRLQFENVTVREEIADEAKAAKNNFDDKVTNGSSP